MSEAKYHEARAAAGRAAVSITDDFDREIAAAVIRGAAMGFLIQAAHFDGWDALLHEVHQIAAAARVPSVSEKPTLCLVS